MGELHQLKLISASTIHLNESRLNNNKLLIHLIIQV